MKRSQMALVLAASTALGACSFTPPEQAAGDFDYAQQQLKDPIEAAPGLEFDAQSQRYQVPEGDFPGALGAQLNIRAPIVVRAVAAGSRVEETEDQVRVYFDELENMDSLAPFVWENVRAGVSQQGIDIVSEQTEQELVTGWVSETALVGEDELEVVNQRRFKVSMDTASHGRTTAVKVEVLESQSQGPGSALYDAEMGQRNAATALLNALIVEVAVAQIDEDILTTRDTSLNVQAGFNQEGFPALVIDGSFATVWALMGQVLPELGFEIDDLNQSTGQYFTTYSEEASGFDWAFWRDRQQGKLPLVDGEYMIRVTGDRTTTTVTLHYNDKPLSADDLTRIFGPFAAEIRKQSGL
ncbi:outer membrane protein assembly factor BamC [Pseudidiomarina taiwanensis]|uniref:Outer membrane protein assembly factor BamC n=1 Tax=Pseudidiomarina taiwanensis TaxID=337250 RepID=A0A432ZMV5_9GAMM|nr:outer membrane protein assembly factor BamC [Pseudidiomarina taiwanensis]RUO79192.1 hypothetical protein CWI83_01380 [Pseudidiomarina taiwanensis]